MRARVPVDVLLDTIQPYPTFSEAIFEALRDLETAARERRGTAQSRARVGWREKLGSWLELDDELRREPFSRL